MSCRPSLRWGRMLAAILGATLALWLLSGDRDPSAAEFVASCKLSQMDTYDVHDVQFFNLDCGKGRAVLSVDGILPIADWMRAHRGERISVALGGTN